MNHAARIALLCFAAGCIRNQVTHRDPTDCGDADPDCADLAGDTGASHGNPDTDATHDTDASRDTDPAGDPDAPVTLADIPGTYASATDATQTVFEAFGMSDPCRGFVQISVDATGQLTGTGACSWPLTPAPVVAHDAGYDDTMLLQVEGQVFAADPALLDPFNSSIRIYDSGSSESNALSGGFVRNARGEVELAIEHDGRLGGVGFASDGVRTYAR